jgi:hypothetical protein
LLGVPLEDSGAGRDARGGVSVSNRSTATKTARKLEKLYQTKKHGTNHMTVLRLLAERGLDGTIEQLEAWGMVANGADDPSSST